MAARSLTAELADQLTALALREPADRLRRGDPALVEDAVGLHASVLGNGKEHVEDLRGQHVIGRVKKQRVDVGLACFQVLLQLGPGGANVVGSFESVHPLVERSRWCGPGHLDWGGHLGGEYSRGPLRCK